TAVLDPGRQAGRGRLIRAVSVGWHVEGTGRPIKCTGNGGDRRRFGSCARRLSRHDGRCSHTVLPHPLFREERSALYPAKGLATVGACLPFYPRSADPEGVVGCR